MKATRVHLSGGLGNQLFQVAAGLTVAQMGDLVIDARFGAPRPGADQTPAVCAYELPCNVSVALKGDSSPSHWLQSLCANYLFASTVRGDGMFGKRISRHIASAAAMILGSPIHRSHGVGYDPALATVSPGTFLFGYFQDHGIASQPSTRDAMRELAFSVESPWIAEMQRAASSQSPLCVHIRLTDYLDESGYGIPSLSYYEHGIALLRHDFPESPLWVFSDDPDSAREYLNPLLRNVQHTFVEPPADGESAAHVLKVMSLCSGYVIANSTFSWWAALLSNARDEHVVAPSPWYRTLEAPVGLIPRTWRTYPAFLV